MDFCLFVRTFFGALMSILVLGGVFPAFAEDCPEIWGSYERLVESGASEETQRMTLFVDQEGKIFNCVGAEIDDEKLYDLTEYLLRVPSDGSYFRIEGSILLPETICTVSEVWFFGSRYYLVSLPQNQVYLDSEICSVRIASAIEYFWKEAGN